MSDLKGYLLLEDGSVHPLGAPESVDFTGGMVKIVWPGRAMEIDSWTVAIGALASNGWRCASVLDRQRIRPGDTFHGMLDIVVDGTGKMDWLPVKGAIMGAKRLIRA